MRHFRQGIVGFPSSWPFALFVLSLDPGRYRLSLQVSELELRLWGLGLWTRRERIPAFLAELLRVRVFVRCFS